MPKQINVKLGFEADTSQAKKQIQDLQKSLDGLLKVPSKETSFDSFSKDVAEAQQSVVKLKSVLDNSLNIDTGRLDLSKFNQQLNQSGLSIDKLASQMNSLGADGQKAFLNLANSIVTAQKPMMETNRLLDGMWTALKNTMRWQLSSSILHGFMSSLQGAYGYAQDLNASLNSIRIVSGQSVDQMSAFADQANRAAQSLSTSTLAYTDAALIFYQQGLSGDAVTERVDTVLKLSNVTGDSAEQVSSYMTAIWNNFYDGSQSLESFADKIAALGAATASSSAEISAGLQQFASVANTVGLSYDYAASALATIVARTRQSESSVGNGLRTIFARLSSLQQGEETEDGVDLTKYTTALKEVGVNVMDQNGQLKEMDQILNEIGEKWDTLSKNQQVALAQTVGGVRQYATLIALFDDWDQFQRNLDVTQNAEGTLQEQQDIYAESWEAAQKRVKAAWQSIYQDLIDDKFFIWLANSVAEVLKGIDGLIDAIGGLKGAIPLVISTIMTLFGDKVANGVDALRQRIRVLTGEAERDADKIAKQTINSLDKLSTGKWGDYSQDHTVENLKTQVQLNNNLRKIKENLKQDEVEYLNYLIKQTEEYSKQSIAAHERLDDAKQNKIASMGNIADIINNKRAAGDASPETTEAINNVKATLNGNDENFNKTINEILHLREIGQDCSAVQEKLIADLTQTGSAVGVTSKDWREYVNAIIDVSERTKDFENITEKEEIFIKAVNKVMQERIPLEKALADVRKEAAATANTTIQSKKEENQALEEQKTQIESNIESLERQKTAFGNNKDMLDALDEEIKEQSQNLADVNEKINKNNEEIEKNTRILNENSDAKEENSNSGNNAPTEKMGVSINSSQIVKGAQAVSQLTMAWNSLSSAYDIVKNEDIPVQERFTKAIAALAFGIPSLINGIIGLKAALIEVIIPFIAANAAIVAIVAALAALGYAAYQFSNQEEIALKKSQEAVKKAKEEWQEAKESYDNLYNSLTSYQEGLKALEELKEGTVEWTKAVTDLNSQVLELLETYPELAQYVSSENGVLKISQEGMQTVINSQYTEAMQKQLDYVNKNLVVSDNQKELNYKDAGNEINYLVGGQEYAVGKEIAQAAAEIWGQDSSLFNKDRIDDLIVALQEHGIELGENANEIATALGEEKAVIADVYSKNIGSAMQAEALQDSIYQQVISNQLSGQEQNLNNEEKSLYNDFLQNKLGEEVSKFEEEKRQEDPDYIATIEDIAMLLDNLVNSYGSGEGLKDAVVNDKLSNMGNQLIENQGLNASDSSTQKIRDDLKEYYNGLSDEDKKLFLTLDIDKETSKEQLDEKLQEVKAEAEEAARNDIEGVRASLDEDVDEEEWESLANYIHDNADEINQFAEANQRLSEDLLNSKKSSAELAEAILRFDDAIQDVTDNYEEWMDMLNSGSVQDKAKAANELADAYGDLLDIDGSQLSANFLESTENLDLMKAAIEGNSDAYDQLQQKMGEDIIAHLEFAPNDLSKFYDELNIIKGMLDRRNFDDLEIGAELNDQAFLNELTNMVNAANMTAEEATAYLASMGIDAEITEQEVDEPEEQEITGFHPEIEYLPTDGQGAYYSVPSGENDKTRVDLPAQFPSVTNVPDKETVVSNKQAKGFTLEVKSAKKRSGGDFKYKHSNHGGGANGAGNTRGNGGKGGGGGGSSSPKKKTVKEHKKHEEKTDRYHDIKERIEDLNTELKRLEKTEKRVYGKAKLKYMDQEIEKLEKQIELTDEYIAEIKKYAATDQANLRGINMGAKFDENGRLTNYEEVLANIVASYNSAVDAYNSAADAFNASAQEEGDQAALDAAEAKEKAAKETYDKRLKILDQYEDTYNLLQQKWDERIDQVWALFDKRLEQVTYRIEFELDWNEKELTQFDWLLKYIGKDADHAADAIANLAKQMDVYQESIDWAKQGIKDIFGLHNINFDFDNSDPQQLYNQLADFMRLQEMESQLTEDEANALLGYIDTLRDSYDGMYDSWIEAHDHMMNAWSEWQERLQEGLNDIAQYGEELEGIQKIVDLTGRKMLKMTTEDINRMNQALVVNAQEYLRAATARRDALEPEVRAAEAHLQELIAGGASEEAIQLARDEYRQMMEDWQDATNDWYSAFADALQAGENAFNAFIEQSTKDYKEGFGKMDLDYMADQFDRQKKVRDLYLDDYQKYHELNKTAQELNKSLAATNNDLIREKLLDLQDDMNASMRDGVQISAAQAEIYARRLALLQAEAELLDAQNAKSAVRMTRDNEGNFSYTYTADQDQIGEAQQNYADKFYELLEYERNYADEVQEEMLQSFQEFIDRRNEIAELYKDDEDAYNQAMMDLREEYLAYMDYYEGELGMVMDDMARLRDDDWLDFERITGLKLAEHDDFITHFHDTILGDLTDSYNTAEELGNHWRALMEEACSKSTKAVQNYQSNTQTTYLKAGENIETYGLKVNQKFDEMANKSAVTADTVTEMANDMVNDMAVIQAETYALDNVWAYVMDDIRNQIASTISALQQLMQSLDLTMQKAQATLAAVGAAQMAASEFAAAAAQQAEQAAQKVADALKGGNTNSGPGTQPPPSGNNYNHGGGGCFAAGTKILMADNTKKNIEDVQIGDMVIAYNIEENKYSIKKVNKTFIHYNSPKKMKLYLSNGEIIEMTPGHPILTKEGWKSKDIINSYFEHGVIATELSLNDKIISTNYKILNILNIEIYEEKNFTVFNIEVDKLHNFIANDIVVHNMKSNQDYLGSSGFATGGYTGAWGPEGKIATLHEKELVLNEEDTSNMLNAVWLMRDLTKNLDLNEAFSQITNGILGAGQLAMAGAGTLDQNVHIEANFPNVQSHSEIELALNNLINSASQYVNRKS